MRSRVEGLKPQLETPAFAPATTPQPKSGAMADGSALGSDQAEFSSVGSELSQKTGDMGVRMDKVASIQAALAAGTYKVSAGAVASRVVDSMLGS
ncbi:MAG: flagellar biosynthesis anti-sigma factor FlgM [Terracidiphilus sp.]